MPRRSKSDALSQSRAKIATKVRELRLAHKLTQRELAKRLRISQNRLSELEGGDGSFTAEQFLELLRLFNVMPGDFVEAPRQHDLALQNALAHLGAVHLQENELVGTSTLREIHDVVREVLLEGSPRLVTALAPVLVLHAGRVNLTKLYVELAGLGFERRIIWLVENSLDALATLARESGSDAKRWLKLKRRAEVPFRIFLDLVATRRQAPTWEGPPDRLDATIRTMKTLEQVKNSASAPSKRWGIVTSLQPEDFVQALRASHAAG
jgi:transcriptional regulator with XRE-family HTH domain